MIEKKPITVAIVAMGGQGGGVLSNWIVQLAENADYYAQSTSVPGVAQRTGSTVYYVELFPRVPNEEKPPVMSLMPTPGDVDVVIAGELLEVGRSVIRGFSSADRSTLIGSTHRDFALSEKIIMTDGRVDADKVLEICKQHSKKFIGFNMSETAAETSSVISSVMFGALSGADVLPFSKEAFETVIREGKVAVESNLKGFNSGYRRSQEVANQDATSISTSKSSSFEVPSSSNHAVNALFKRVTIDFPKETHEIVCNGIVKLLDYQDVEYAKEYLEKLDLILDLDRQQPSTDYQLTAEVGRYLALRMAYEDGIRVADLKTRKDRYQRIRGEVKAAPGQIVVVREYMHPRVEEICDLLPSSLAKFVLNGKAIKGLLGRMCNKGRIVNTSSLPGFVLLYMLSGLRAIRRSTYRHKLEGVRITGWMNLVLETAKTNYDLALELVECQRMVKGYGNTFDRGLERFETIMGHIENLIGKKDASEIVKKLREAALSDEEGKAFDLALKQLLPSTQAARAA